MQGNLGKLGISEKAFSDILKSSGGNAVYISKASGNVAKTLGLEKELENAKETKPSTIKLGSNFKTIREEDTAAYLSDHDLERGWQQ